MKVFVSSVVGSYSEFRTAAKAAIDALDHHPVLMELTHPASASPPQEECFAQIEDSDVVVMLLGARYGALQQSEKSATHEEWEHARLHNKPILLFVEDMDASDRDPDQQAFLEEIGVWEDGSLWKPYSTPVSLVTEIANALKAHESRSRDVAVAVSIERLPLPCRERLESLRESSPALADRLVELLCDPASRQPTVLSRLAHEPPGWLAEAGYTAWEVISDFIGAHSLRGTDSARRRAIEAGSPRSAMLMINQAEALADAGDAQGAAELMDQVPSEHPLLGTARAHIGLDASGVVDAVLSDGLHRSEDPEVALYAVGRLAMAHWRLHRPDLARSVLRDANARFPDRAWLLLHEANAVLGVADQGGHQTTGGQDLLREAVELALRSRDCFRMWDGPSHLAVAVAMRARLGTEDPQQAAVLGLVPPEGEATDSEATSAAVQPKLAHAMLMLGRYDEIDTVRLDAVDAVEAALIRAMQARGRDDPAARSQMRRAVAQASEDPIRRHALLGLALFGEIDETQMAEVSESDAALFRGVAALNRDALEEAQEHLDPHWLDSPIHAAYLADAQHRAGATHEAVQTLTGAAESLETEWLLVPAVVMLVEADHLGEAAEIASDALDRNLGGLAQHRLRSLLAEIAERRQDWQMMEQHTRALVRESPQDRQAAWAVVHALWRQAKYQQAWGFIVGHDLTPFNEQSARLMIAVCADADSPEDTAGPLLEIAHLYADSEVVVGSAIAAVMMGGDRVRLTDAQRVQLNELTQDFLARFPDSDVLRSYSFSEPEEILEVMGDFSRDRALHLGEFVDQVRYGRLPYGLLQQVSGLSYTELLLSVAAGSITAIAADEQRRDRERRAAEAALGTVIAVDTSVTATGINADIDVRRLAHVFQRTLVGDELIADARTAVARASQPVEATVFYEPALGRPSMTLIDEQQRSAQAERAQNALEILDSWQSVASGPLPPPGDAQHLELRPWDASIRVALHRRCALWSDDLALRSLAEHEGIPTFGTWALYEALASTPAGVWLAPPTEMKMRLLRARIADVPITIPELSQATDSGEVLDTAVCAYLSRPLVWATDPMGTLEWFRALVTSLVDGANDQWVPGLFSAASFGLGTSVDPAQRGNMIGALLVTGVLRTQDPSLVPALVTAARTTAGHLDPTDPPDPLPDAVRRLLEALEQGDDPRAAAQTVVRLFSEAEPADRDLVTSIVIGDR